MVGSSEYWLTELMYIDFYVWDHVNILSTWLLSLVIFNVPIFKDQYTPHKHHKNFSAELFYATVPFPNWLTLEF